MQRLSTKDIILLVDRAWLIALVSFFVFDAVALVFPRVVDTVLPTQWWLWAGIVLLLVNIILRIGMREDERSARATNVFHAALTIAVMGWAVAASPFGGGIRILLAIFTGALVLAMLRVVSKYL